MGERNLNQGSGEITISAVHGSEHATFVATFPGDERDGSAKS